MWHAGVGTVANRQCIGAGGGGKSLRGFFLWTNHKVLSPLLVCREAKLVNVLNILTVFSHHFYKHRSLIS